MDYWSDVCFWTLWLGRDLGCPNNIIAKYIESIFFAKIDTLVWVELKVLEPVAIEAYDVPSDQNLQFGSSAIIMAYTAAVKLAPDITMSCLSLRVNIHVISRVSSSCWSHLLIWLGLKNWTFSWAVWKRMVVVQKDVKCCSGSSLGILCCFLDSGNRTLTKCFLLCQPEAQLRWVWLCAA